MEAEKSIFKIDTNEILHEFNEQRQNAINKKM